MGRNLYTTLLFFCCFISIGWGQSLELVSVDTLVQGKVGSTLQSSISIRNNSIRPIFVKVEKVPQILAEDHSAYFRLGEETTPIRMDISVNSVKIAPNEVFTEFTGFLSSGNSEGKSSVIYRFYNERNPSDFVESIVKFDVASSPEALEDKLIDSPDIFISKLYPNPATTFAAFDYKLKGNQKNAFIIIRNVLGSEVAKFELPPYENQLKFGLDSFKSGIYFYTLSMDDQTLVSQKFMVKR